MMMKRARRKEKKKQKKSRSTNTKRGRRSILDDTHLTSTVLAITRCLERAHACALYVI